jgi:hypothetical protein
MARWIAPSFKAVVPGNHETFLEADPSQRSLLSNATILINEGIEIEGSRLWGSPVTPLYSGACGLNSAKDRKRLYAQIPEDIDVLISHGPPYGILDLAPGIQFVSQREAIDTEGALGRAILVIISAIAGLEKSLIVERVRAGMRRAKLEGRRIGRTPLDVDHAALVRDRLSGMSLTIVAKKHGLSRASVVRFVRDAKARHGSIDIHQPFPRNGPNGTPLTAVPPRTSSSSCHSFGTLR